MKGLLLILLFSTFPVFPVSAEERDAFDLQALPVVLKEKATVTDDRIRLGDLFTGLDETLDKKAVAPAPALGKEAVLTYEWLKKLARTNGVVWEPSNEKASVTVYRKADEISKDEISKILTGELQKQGMPEDAEITFQKGDFPVLVPFRSAWRLNPVAAEYVPARQHFSIKAELIVDSEKKQELLFAGKVKVFMNVPVAMRDLKAGQIITADDVFDKRVVQENNSRMINQVKTQDLIGKEVKRAIRSGQTIQSNDVRAQVMVAKGKIVTLNYSKGGIMLSAQGKALENGGLGDTVRVMNAQSKSVIQGTVTGPETVSVLTTGK